MSQEVMFLLAALAVGVAGWVFFKLRESPVETNEPVKKEEPERPAPVKREEPKQPAIQKPAGHPSHRKGK